MNRSGLSAPQLFVALLSLCLPSVSHAQEEAPAQASANDQRDTATGTVPTPNLLLRAVRLSFLAGAIRIQRSDNTAEETAVLNMPLGEGTRILSGDYGQAEIEFEDGSVARLTPRSAVSINVLSLDSSKIAHTELAVLGGLAYFELRKSPGYTWMLEAGGTSMRPLENLIVRVNLDQPPAIFAVLTGTAHLERSGSERPAAERTDAGRPAEEHPAAFEADLHAGETLRADASDDSRYILTAQVAQESWDSWNESRDRAAADAADKRTAARDDYAAEQGYGWSDLDASGNWYNVPGTGQVWQPGNADEGFDPYGYGAWVWGSGAYVWASGYTWGWTPFRCGHWQYFNGFGWGWSPDPYCGRWAFAGGGYLGESGRSGVFVRGPYPSRHNPVIRPFPRPGQLHPVVPVRGPDGPRPWTPHTGPTRIAGTPAAPLPPIGSGAFRSGSVAGGSLVLDYPVDRKTHQPILGTVSSSSSSSQPVYGNAAPAPPRLAPGTRRPHPEDAPGSASPNVGTSWRLAPAPDHGLGSSSLPTQRQGWGTAPNATPHPMPAPGSEPRTAPVAPPVRTPSAAPPPSRPSPPPSAL